MKRILSVIAILALILSLTAVAFADADTAETGTETETGSEAGAADVSLDPELNLAFYGEPFATNSAAIYPPELAFDNNTSTNWRAQDDPAPELIKEEDGTYSFKDELVLGVAFDVSVAFDKIELEFSVDRPAGDESGYAIQVSDDGETWTDAENAEYTFAEFTAAWQEVADHTVDTVTFTEPALAKFVRVYFKKPCIDLKSPQSVFEMRIFESTGGLNADLKALIDEATQSVEPPVISDPPVISETPVISDPPAAGSEAPTASEAAPEKTEQNGLAPWIIPTVIAAVVAIAAAVVAVVMKKRKK